MSAVHVITVVQRRH